MVRYTCLRAMLPTVEAALAAHGYTMERPLQADANGDRMVVMTQLSAVVLLAECSQSEVADIEVYGAAQDTATALLETLPLNLAKQPLHRQVGYERSYC